MKNQYKGYGGGKNTVNPHTRTPIFRVQADWVLMIGYFRRNQPKTVLSFLLL